MILKNVKEKPEKNLKNGLTHISSLLVSIF